MTIQGVPKKTWEFSDEFDIVFVMNEYNFLTYNKQHYHSHYISDKGIKGTVVNQTLEFHLKFRLQSL